MSFTPTIDGQLLHFEYRGLFNGVSLLWDSETGSYWHHITGKALDGPMKGRQMPMYNLLLATVEQALEGDPDLMVAISDREIRTRSRWSPLTDRVRMLSDRLRRTMRGEDSRRPEMDIGLGVWTNDTQTYYPMEVVNDKGGFVFDRIDGRGVLIYIEPTANTVAALYTEARGASWDGTVLRMNNGRHVRAGGLFDGDSEVRAERPMQVFTRWYGYALTFPGTGVYGGG